MTPVSLLADVEKLSRTTEKSLRQAERELRAGTEQEVRLEHQISVALSEIASLQLQHMPALDQDIRQQLQEREQAQANLHTQLEQTEQQIAATLAGQQTLHARLEALDGQALDRLDQDATFRDLAERLQQTRQSLPQALAAYEEIRDECAAKLPSFWLNPIYRFLKIRNYGTERYKPGRLQRWSDDFLARKVDFRGNHAIEQTLLAMQARNEVQYQARIDELAQLEQQHHDLVDAAREAMGMEPLKAEDQSLSEQIAHDKALANTLHEQLATFTERRDPHLQRISQNLAERIRNRPLDELVREAASTPDTRDDELVKTLQTLQPHLREVRKSLERLHRLYDEARSNHERAKDAERAVRNDYYQDRNYSFQLPQPFGQLLASYMLGDMNLPTLELLLQTARTYVHVPSPARQTTYTRSTTTRTTSWSSSSSSSSSSRSSASTSSSSGSGGFSSSSSSGGSGFRTTDSF